MLLSFLFSGFSIRLDFALVSTCRTRFFNKKEDKFISLES